MLAAPRPAEPDSGKLGKYGGLRDPDLLVGLRDPALRRGDVRTPLQQRRRHADRDVGNRAFPGRPLRQGEVGRGLAHQHRDRVLQHGALVLQPQQVGLRVGQLGLGLQRVGAGHDAGVVAVLGDAQAALVALDGLHLQRDQRVEHPQVEIVDRELALGRQPGELQVAATLAWAPASAPVTARPRRPQTSGSQLPPMLSW